MSYLEIYNEVIYDLLSTLPQNSPSAAAPPASTGLQVTDVRASCIDVTPTCCAYYSVCIYYTTGWERVCVCQGANTEASLQRGRSAQLSVWGELALSLLYKIMSVSFWNYNYYAQGETNRSISDHALNKNSSRSHCIFTIYIEVSHSFMWFKLTWSMHGVNCRVAPELSQTQPTLPPSWT